MGTDREALIVKIFRNACEKDRDQPVFLQSRYLKIYRKLAVDSVVV